MPADPPKTLFVAIDRHFARYCSSRHGSSRHDGRLYSDLTYDYQYWKEYLAVVDQVRPIARVRDAAELDPAWRRADGEGVRFFAVTSYRGFWSFLRRSPRVLWDCRRAVRQGDAFLLRWGLVAVVCWLWLEWYRKPYGFECIGHAGQGVVGNRQLRRVGLDRLIGWTAHQLCRSLARRASCVAYVSRYAQGLYPGKHRDRQWIFSSVQLTGDVVTGPRPATSFRQRGQHIVSVGRLEPEKGHAVLIRAIALLIEAGREVRATVVGPGRQLEPLRKLAAQLGVGDRVLLPGRVTWGSDLWRILDDGDVFVLPSLTEGMPRAMIEAMARGLPCIGSAAGGITELLGREDLAPPGDASALARCIAGAIGDTDRLAAMSRRAFARARKYLPDTMKQRKQAFWRCILDQTR